MGEGGGGGGGDLGRNSKGRRCLSWSVRNGAATHPDAGYPTTIATTPANTVVGAMRRKEHLRNADETDELHRKRHFGFGPSWHRYKDLHLQRVRGMR